MLIFLIVFIPCVNFLLAFDEEVDCPVTSPLREQPVIRPNIPSILFVSYHTQQLNGILNMEYVQ